MDIDFDKYERLERQHVALSAEVNHAKERVHDLTQSEMLAKETLKRAIRMQYPKPSTVNSVIEQYDANPQDMLREFERNEIPALSAAKDHQRIVANLHRAQASLNEANNRLRDFRPSFNKVRDFIHRYGV